MQVSSLHEMSNPVFWGKIQEKYNQLNKNLPKSGNYDEIACEKLLLRPHIL